MILTLLIISLMSAIQTEAVSDSTLTFRQTVFVNADYAKQPVVSLSRSDAGVVDTLDTLNEYVKIVLRADNTWEYMKLPGGTWDQEIFSQYWENSTANPYKKLQSDLPRAWAIWLVDSLNQYHCPFQGNVHPNGKYGVRRGRPHQGVDLPLKTGDPIYATFTGQVRVARYDKGYGNFVVIRHENGLETFYGHLSERKVSVGDWVNAGQVIGLGGSTGRSTGPHLHYETRYQGFSFDPQWLIDFKTGELRHRLFILKKKYFSQYCHFEQNFDDEAYNEEQDLKEEAERAAMRWHVVRSGDTLYGLALKNKTTVAEICRLNGISSKSPIRIGQKLRVR